VLSRLDDYPIHQTPDPICQPGESHPNFYDRYWFNGYDQDGAFYFGVAMGLYPNRRVMDCSFSLVKDGVQHAFHASRLAPDDPSETEVGPFRIEVVEPMRVLRVSLAPNETGIEAQLLFRPRTACVEEVRTPMRRDRRIVMDTTRFTQFGTWEGHVVAGGERVEISPVTTRATRDRSWGIRPVGEPMGGKPAGEGQIFFLWAPLQFDDVCTHAGSFETADGQPWDNFSVLMPAYAKESEIPGVEDPGARRLLGVRHDIEFQKGTRWASRAKLELVDPSGENHAIELEAVLRFNMLGIGYVNPEWGHGIWKGDLVIGGESWNSLELDPLDMRHRHVQQVVKARWGDREGVGVLEQIIFGPFDRYGFTGHMDGA
jgi:hypothetical protein